MSSTLLAVDRLHSPLARFGACNSIAAYLPYGHKSGLIAKPSIGFTGQLCEPAAGWYLLGNGHRVYSPMLMCFHSPDKLSPFEKGGINAYAYCQRDPINLIDTTGKFAVEIVTYYLAGKISLELLNLGLKQWKKAVAGSSRPWSDPLKFAEYTSHGLKFSTLALLAGAEVTKKSAPAITNPNDQFEVYMNQTQLQQADIVKGVAMITGFAAIAVDSYVSGVELDRARKKAYLNKHTENIRRGDEEQGEAGADAALDIGTEGVTDI